jgi:hypothetical protein
MNVDPLVRTPEPGKRLQPRLLNPILMCACCKKPTMHSFIAARSAGEVGAYDHRYGCSLCSTERRYGLFG